MVLAAKIFEIKDEGDIDFIIQKIKNFREEEPFKTNDGKDTTLITEILDIEQKEDIVSGIISKDFVSIRHYRREVVETTITEEAFFWIKIFKKKTFLIVIAPSGTGGGKKLISNYVATKISNAIFFKPWGIVEVRIPHETLKNLHESNPQATKLIWFDDVDIPSIGKLCLAGNSLVDTKLYHDYLEHGKIWYVVFEVQKRGIVVGITRNCVITLFSKTTTRDFINYILEDFLILID